MPRGEKAVIYVKSQYYTESTLMPVVEGVDEVHFEVELVHFIQVDAVYLDHFESASFYCRTYSFMYLFILNLQLPVTISVMKQCLFDITWTLHLT